MQDILLVRRGQAGAQLSRNLVSFVRRKPADTAQERRQLLALDVFHREKVTAVDFADVVNSADIVVRHLPGDANFAMKPGQCGAVSDQMIRQELEGDRLA